MLRGPLNRLAVRIAFASVLVTVLVGGIVLWQVDRDLKRDAQARYSSQVSRARMQTEQQLQMDVTLRVTGATVLAGVPQFVDAVERRDLAATLQVANTFMARTTLSLAGASGIHVYDADGVLLLRAEAPGRPVSGPAVPEAKLVLLSGAPGGSVRRDEVLGIAISGIAPMIGSRGQPIGAVEAISSLDDTYVRTQATLVGTAVSVLADGRVIATSDPGMTINPAAITDAQRAAAVKTPIYLASDSKRYLSSLVTLRNNDGRIIGDVAVGIAEATIGASIASTRAGIVRAVVAGVMVAITAASGLAWLTVRPVAQLVGAARRIQHNDLESPVPRAGAEELRELGGAMDEMRRAVRQGREALLLANRDLALRVAASAASLSEVTQDLEVMQAIVSQLAGTEAGGLPGVAEALLRLDWVDGAFIALATETGSLSPAATAGLAPGAATTVLDVIRAGLPGQSLEQEISVENTMTEAEADRLRAWFIDGFASQPVLTPDGVAGIVCVTSVAAMPFTPQRREMLRSVAHEIAATLERSELAGEVEENRRIAESVLREMGDGVIVVDHQDVCRICNPAAARLLELARVDIVGQPAEAWLPLPEGAIVGLRERAQDRARGTGAPLLAQVNGRQLAITSGPFHDPDPRRSGMIILIRDLSAEAEAERVKRDFVSMVGHELRTPLTLIRTTIDLLHEHDAGALNATQERIVEVLRQNSDRLMSLISDLLDMSALDSGRMQIKPAAVDLAAVVHAAVEAARGPAEQHRHTLHVTVPRGVFVWADAERVGQVLSNLLSNAIKYTPAGGQLAVRVDDTGPLVSVSVADSGVGIPPEEQTRLFEKFYRTSTGRRTTGGTGLGLAITRSIVELHGGTIGCDSDGEHGTTFTFTLPRRPL